MVYTFLHIKSISIIIHVAHTRAHTERERALHTHTHREKERDRYKYIYIHRERGPTLLAASKATIRCFNSSLFSSRSK